MPSGKQVKVYGKSYNLKSDTSSEDLDRVASYVDAKMRELGSGKGKASTVDLAVLAALNIAQELMDLKNGEEQGGRENKKRLEQLLRTLNSELQSIKKKGSGAPR